MKTMFNNPRKETKAPSKPRSRVRKSTPVRSTGTPTKKTPAYTSLPTQSKPTKPSAQVRSTGTPTKSTSARPGASSRPQTMTSTRVQGTGTGPSKGSGLKVPTPAGQARAQRKVRETVRRRNGTLRR